MVTASIVSTRLSFLRSPVRSFPSYHSSDSPPPPPARSPVFMLINQDLVLSLCIILLIIWHNSFLSPRYLYFPGETGHTVSWYLYRFARMLSFRLQCWFFVLFPTWHCWKTHDSVLHPLSCPSVTSSTLMVFTFHLPMKSFFTHAYAFSWFAELYFCLFSQLDIEYDNPNVLTPYFPQSV